MKKNGIILGLAIVVIAFVSSCGKLPQTEIDAAKTTLDSLKAHGADLILPDEFAGVQKTMDDAMALVDVQNSKTFKSFGAVKEKLAAVITDAAALEGKNAEKKAELMKEIDEIMEAVTTMNNDTKNMIPKSGNVSSTLRMLQKDAQALDTSLQDIKTMIEGNDLIAALEKLKEVKTEAERINSDVKSAIAAHKPVVKKPNTTSTTSGQSRPMKKK